MKRRKRPGEPEVSEETIKVYEYNIAIVKWNDGFGALLCNKCQTMIYDGFSHEDQEYLCDKCEEEKTNNWNY